MALELKLREDDRGGGVRPPTRDHVQALLGARRVLLLIHGYNNDYAFARDEAYPGFELLQRDLAGVGKDGDYAPGWLVCKVYWPGDADFGLLSALFYPWIVKHAPQVGEALAGLLHAGAGDAGLEVAIVSHSLGCRVVAELLRALPAGSRARVTRVAFFAAALGTDKLADARPGSLGAALATRVEDGAISLYSGADRVLSLSFPLGQTLAPGDEGCMPVALGHGLWASTAAPAVLEQAHNPDAGHSDYWGWREQTRDTCGLRANEAARAALRLGGFERRLTPARQAPVRQAAEGRAVPVRGVGDSWWGPAGGTE